MICEGCGRVIDDQPDQTQSCGRCAGACRKIHCPWCGQEHALVPAYLQRLRDQAQEPKEST